MLGSASNSTVGVGQSSDFFGTGSFLKKNRRDLITGSTIDFISEESLSQPLIARLAGRKKFRKSSFDSLEEHLNGESLDHYIDDLSLLPGSKAKFVTLDFSDRIGLNKSTFLGNLIDSGIFKYLEFDSEVSVFGEGVAF